jgi:hypothetical protein
MRLPRLLLALIDPASAAMDSRNWSRRRPLYRGGAVFGSGVPGGSRQATPEEIEAIRRHSQQQQRAEGSPVGSHPHQHAAELAARELIRTGTATLHGTERTLCAKVIRFWHGDSILIISTLGTPAKSMTRIPRRLGPEHENLIASYLISHRI